jgi:diacylglycerol kinase family enzyme
VGCSRHGWARHRYPGGPPVDVTPPAAADLIVLANPAAGKHSELEGAVQRAFDAVGLTARVARHRPAELLVAARRAAGRGDPVLAVFGGDGTHSLAAEALAGSETALAPLPGGTVNTFARRLGLDDLDAAARAVASGRWRRVPVGRAAERTFVSTATFGEYARVVRRRERLRRWLPKWPAAAVAFVLTATSLRHLDVVLEIDSAVLRRRTPLVWSGIGPGSFPLPQRAPPLRGDPPLEIAILRPGSRWQMTTLLLGFPVRMLAGEAARESPAFELLQSSCLRLSCHRAPGATLDGEPAFLRSPLGVTVLAGALRVVGPEVGSSG